MTDERYNELFNQGYDARFQGEEQPPEGLSQAERQAWQHGYSTAAEEDDDA